MEQRAQSPNMAMMLAGGAAVGMVAITAYQMGSTKKLQESGEAFADPVRKRLSQAYTYLGASLGATAVGAGYIFRSGIAHRMAAMNPIVTGIGLFAGQIAGVVILRSMDYHENLVGKHVALAGFVGLQALMMAPL